MDERVTGTCSLGLCGYEVWPDPDRTDHLFARFVGGAKEYKARSYLIQVTPAGRTFIRPDGRRIYLDQIMRMPPC